MRLPATLTIAFGIAVLTAASAIADYNAGLRAYKAKDYVRALKEFKTDGGKDSNYNLGVMYFKGEGVKADHLQGLELFKKAAAQGHANACFLLGTSYDKGVDVQQDREVAAKWYLKAAALGHAQAQFNIGLMYTNGEGVEKNRKEAVVWLKKAATQGHKGAGKLLSVMGEEVPKAARSKSTSKSTKSKNVQPGELPPGHPK
ncbi:MAG: sel1 repeat family protein [Geobacteraceae bacterium]|nr:sel1 repeat family protein [Geobacteraceae bacterium]NTW79832.1 sel1 repeat family protein [Geobacteraceae bacterium]